MNYVGKVSNAVDTSLKILPSLKVVSGALYSAGFDIESINTEEVIPNPRKVYRWWSLLLHGSHKHNHQMNCSECRTGLQEEKEKKRQKEESLNPVSSNDGTIFVTSGDELHLDQFRALYSVGGMTCASCVNSITAVVNEHFPSVSDFAVDLMNKSAMAIIENKPLASKIQVIIRDAGFNCDLVELLPVSTVKSYTVTASIGGLTCAACVNSINNSIAKLSYVKEFNISLLTNSGTFVIDDEAHTRSLKERIEDMGFDFIINEVKQSVSANVNKQSRKVNLSISGMFCTECPEQINESLRLFGDAIVIDDPVSLSHPYVEFTYVPSPPTVTIRSILKRIGEISPQFNTSIIHPLSLEELSAQMARREQKRLLSRLIVTVLIAVPTFVIGVIAMALLPKSNHFYQLVRVPLFGKMSRMTFSLFWLATPVYFYSASVFHKKAFQEVRSLWNVGVPWTRRFFRFGSMNLLMCLGTSIAYWASFVLMLIESTLKGDITHEKTSGMGMMSEGFTTTYFDSVVFLTMFLLIGRMLESFSKTKAADSVSMLAKLRPNEAHLVEVASEVNKPLDIINEKLLSIDLLEVGDYIKILPGMSPPADCIIVSNATFFDESALTGESRPVPHKFGEQIFAGTINVGKSYVIAKVIALEGSSMLDQIVEIVRQGQLHRAPIERVADKLTGYFVPIVTLIAILTWIIWISLGYGGALPEHYLDIEFGGWAMWSLEFCIAVFVIACPCGIGLAAPTALFVGSGLAAKFGILAQGGGEAFQEGSRVDILCFDKTGTLTEGGEPKVQDELYFKNDEIESTREDIYYHILLELSRDLELNSTHPLGIALRDYCESKFLTQYLLDNKHILTKVEEISGKGLKGDIDAIKLNQHTKLRELNLTAGFTSIILGNERFMNENSAFIDSSHEQIINEWKREGKSIILIAVNSDESPSNYKTVLAFSVTDRIRPEASEVIKTLNEIGIQTWMITGDNKMSAQAVAKVVGIPVENVISDVLPNEKAEKIRWLQKNGHATQAAGDGKSNIVLNKKITTKRSIVAMIGDGINDAPSLTMADVGIAMGNGSDIALSSAKFILLKPDLRLVLILFRLSRKIFNRVKFNFFWALIYNTIGIPIAAGVIYPYNNSRLDPVWASLAMALSSVSVVLSSLALRLYKPTELDYIEEMTEGKA
ncbi:heavy metal translocatin [Nadsonia fulvescens var. elongata DSM 6958]|uniref:Heavy metal translocatin n=1 Tax=Nadsonia fulvescens var. elongata DSM 6958 TaxID=857566 RepID=A0A1E3PSQ9_9ASCO|nr:heavy metal translocatin [Nadsonia fulvescens var. elongata DSM 6958]